MNSQDADVSLSNHDWAANAIDTAKTLERLEALADVFGVDKEGGADYTKSPRFKEIRTAWKDKYVSMGGDLKKLSEARNEHRS